MKYTVLFLLAFLSCTSEKRQESTPVPSNTVPSLTEIYDFRPDSLGYASPQEVALQVIDFLRTKDTSLYLSTIIPLKGQQYLFAQNLEYRPDIKDQSAFLDKLTNKYDRRVDNFLVRSHYILQIMEEDKNFDITAASIDTITYEDVRIKSYGGFNSFIIGQWADLTVKMSYKDKPYYFEIPQVIQLKDKWFLYYPEYYLRTQKELDFVKKSIEEINAKAEEFWL
ncbi:MAG: hypothetical protein ACRBFS_03355 [Aureispira sp.]